MGVILVLVLPCRITEPAVLSALCPLLPFHEYLSGAVAHIGSVLNLCDLHIFLLFLAQLALLTNSLHETHLILHELVEFSPLDTLVELPGGQLRTEDTVFNLFLGLFLTHFPKFILLFLHELIHLRVEFVL